MRRGPRIFGFLGGCVRFGGVGLSFYLWCVEKKTAWRTQQQNREGVGSSFGHEQLERYLLRGERGSKRG